MKLGHFSSDSSILSANLYSFIAHELSSPPQIYQNPEKFENK